MSSSFLGTFAYAPFAPPVPPDPLSDHDGGQDVFECREFGKQVVELEDHPKAAIAQTIAFGGGQVVDALVFKVNLALVGCVECCEQVEQRALARSALPDDRREGSVTCGKIDALQDRDRHLPFLETLIQVAGDQLLAVALCERVARCGV